MFNAAASGKSLVAGFVVGAATSAASSYLRIGTAVADVVISGIGNIYEQKMNNPTGKIDWREVAVSAAVGGISSYIGAKTVSTLATAIGTSKVAKAVVTTVTTTFTTTASISGSAIYESLQQEEKIRPQNNKQKKKNAPSTKSCRNKRRHRG